MSVPFLLTPARMRRIRRRTKGGPDSTLHAVCDGQGRPGVMMLSAGQMNDRRGARLLAPVLPPPREPIAERGCGTEGAQRTRQSLPRGVG